MAIRLFACVYFTLFSNPTLRLQHFSGGAGLCTILQVLFDLNEKVKVQRGQLPHEMSIHHLQCVVFVIYYLCAGVRDEWKVLECLQLHRKGVPETYGYDE